MWEVGFFIVEIIVANGFGNCSLDWNKETQLAESWFLLIDLANGCLWNFCRYIPTGVLFDLLCAQPERPWNLTVWVFFFSFYFTVSLSGKLVLGWLDWLLCCSSFRKCGTLKLGEVTHWLLACLWRKLWLIELSIIDGQWDFNYSTFTLRFEVLGKKN